MYCPKDETIEPAGDVVTDDDADEEEPKRLNQNRKFTEVNLTLLRLQKWHKAGVLGGRISQRQLSFSNKLAYQEIEVNVVKLLQQRIDLFSGTKTFRVNATVMLSTMTFWHG
jgi:hypothetical protein